jgi:predicted amidohydrolase
MPSVRLALCQMAVTAVKAANLAKATSMIAAARAEHNADVVVLPECFSCPYGTKFFPEYAEPIPPVGAGTDQIAAQGAHFQSALALSRAAAANGVWLVGGSVPEEVLPSPPSAAAAPPSGRRTLFNSCMIFSPDGVLRAVHRKVHLFRINTETVKMDEGDVLTAGDSPTVVDVAPLPGANANAAHAAFSMGVGICFDIRFPLLAAYYHERGTSLLVYPGAFNMVTGPPHWLFAARSRAVDAQQFVAVCSVARDTKADYVAYGHSAIVDPWGDVVAEAGEGEQIVAADVDMQRLASVRARLPITAGVRRDLYQLAWRGPAASHL